MIAILLSLLLTLNVNIYPTDTLSIETLTSRTENDLIIEYVEGQVIDIYGNGYTFTDDPYFNYISYSCVENYIQPGDIIQSYFVYNPLTKYEDDILYRIDVLPDGNMYLN